MIFADFVVRERKQERERERERVIHYIIRRFRGAFSSEVNNMIPPLLPPSTVLFVEKAVVFISRAFFCVFIEDFFKVEHHVKGIYINKMDG
jgi:hypothetical protein|tara:strand:+ start:2588 stop:2860 length:273 start_codon:yes stop_codon:yes gene_type:complete